MYRNLDWKSRDWEGAGGSNNKDYISGLDDDEQMNGVYERTEERTESFNWGMGGRFGLVIFTMKN
jgi:hypothetical protein